MLEPRTIKRYKEQLRRLADIAKKNHKSHPPLQIIDVAIDKVFEHYYEYEKRMKACMEPEKPDNELDRHKIAAAFFCAIIKAKPLAYMFGNAPVFPFYYVDNNEQMANNECAYKFGLQILQDFSQKFSDESDSPDEKIIYGQKIMPPETHDGFYEQWFYKLISDRVTAHLDYEERHFADGRKVSFFEEEAVFLLAHIYFMIENHSYQFNKANYFEAKAKRD